MKINKSNINEIVNLYIRERDTFSWLISIEEFAKDYVEKCKECGELFLNDADNKICEDCIEHNLEEERLNDNYEYSYFDENKDHYVYGMY